MSEEFIPFLQEMLTMLFNKSHDPAYFGTAATSGPLDHNRVKPELSNLVFMPHVDMRRFPSIQ
jgi:hypothetical protein